MKYAYFLAEEYNGAIDVSETNSVILEDNFVAGAQRMGINFRGDICQGSNTLSPGLTHSIKGNIVYAALTGVSILPILPLVADVSFYLFFCRKISGFTIFKSTHWGIYYHGFGSIIIDSNILIENQVGIFTFIYEPKSKDHEIGYKRAILQNNLLVGQSPTFNCKNDFRVNDYNALKAVPMFAFGAGPNYDSKIGLIWSNFLDEKYDKPYKLWPGTHSYPQINGITRCYNLTFAHWGVNCFGSNDSIIATNMYNDDAQHPVIFQGTKLNNVNLGSKVWIHRPNLEKINPTACFDMDCDGLKKALLTDIDGTFLGSSGFVFSQSEFGWGDQSRGLGDFRIPKEALNAPNGSMLKVSDVYSYPGIVRDEQLCQYKSFWQAYECHNLTYKMLIIESMDSDSETRRLSPVAILSDNKYLDLINGPQDNHWCGGYSCMKRISTFYSLVAANKSYDIYLTATPPSQIRFRILDADTTFKIRLSLYYSKPQRVDLYLNEKFTPPTNADYSSGKMQIKDPKNNIASYMPSYLNDSGTNLFYSVDRKVYFSIDGATSYIDLKVASVLYIRFGLPAITPDQFFNSPTLVGNFALLLGVDPTKIRLVEIVRAKSKKRQTDSLNYVILTLYDDPVSTLNDTNTVNNASQEINRLNARISNMYMTGQLQVLSQSILNVSLASLSVQPPAANASVQSVVKISKTFVAVQATNCNAQIPCLIQPSIMVVDENVKIQKKVLKQFKIYFLLFFYFI